MLGRNAHFTLILAEAQNQQSLHIMVMGKQDTQAGGSNQVKRTANVQQHGAASNMYLKPFFD